MGLLSPLSYPSLCFTNVCLCNWDQGQEATQIFKMKFSLTVMFELFLFNIIQLKEFQEQTVTRTLNLPLPL